MFFRTAGEELQHLVHVEKVERFKVGHTKLRQSVVSQGVPLSLYRLHQRNHGRIGPNKGGRAVLVGK